VSYELDMDLLLGLTRAGYIHTRIHEGNFPTVEKGEKIVRFYYLYFPEGVNFKSALKFLEHEKCRPATLKETLTCLRYGLITKKVKTVILGSIGIVDGVEKVVFAHFDEIHQVSSLDLVALEPGLSGGYNLLVTKIQDSDKLSERLLPLGETDIEWRQED
jgi:hypothetical protein